MRPVDVLSAAAVRASFLIKIGATLQKRKKASGERRPPISDTAVRGDERASSHETGATPTPNCADAKDSGAEWKPKWSARLISQAVRKEKPIFASKTGGALKEGA